AVAKSGTNEFHSGAKVVLTPENWREEAKDSYFEGERYLTRSRDTSDSTRMNIWASGPLVKDKLFFFAMYEGRQIDPQNTDNDGNNLTDGNLVAGFWGTTLDLQVTGDDLLSLMAFSNENRANSTTYAYAYDSDTVGQELSTGYSEGGGKNWALAWTP